MYNAGLINYISLPATNASNVLIQTSIEVAFAGLNPPLSSYDGWQILTPLGSGQGGPTHLIPMRLRVPGLIGSGDIALYVTILSSFIYSMFIQGMYKECQASWI